MAKSKASTGRTWQAQKSALTRDRIVVATLECIVENGYERTTMSKIAGIANVSLGSMQYHFKTKLDAIKAAVNYLLEKRLADHQRDLQDMPKGANPMEHAIDVYWSHLSEGHFIAYQDLVVAGRINPELAAVLKPAYQRFVTAWRKDALSMASNWKGTREQFDLICDLGQYQMEGQAFGQLNNQLDQEQVKKVVEFTKHLLVNMMVNTRSQENQPDKV